MGNHQISITAEFVSLIKSKNNPKYYYFVSNKTKKISWFLSKIFSKRKMAEIFSNRIKISDEFDKFLERNNFDCVVEFGCGYSLRGFEYSLKNEKSLYIDTDFSEVVKTKKQILDTICEKENIKFPKNYLLISLDVLKNNIFRNLDRLLKKKNLFFAEGLTPYFSEEEYLKFITQIQPFVSSKNNVFFSQENFLKKSSITYKILRKLVVFLTKNRSYLKFETKEDLINYLKQKGFEDCQGYYKNNNLFYRIN